MTFSLVVIITDVLPLIVVVVIADVLPLIIVVIADVLPLIIVVVVIRPKTNKPIQGLLHVL
jgi:hypothetical protein